MTLRALVRPFHKLHHFTSLASHIAVFSHRPHHLQKSWWDRMSTKKPKSEQSRCKHQRRKMYHALTVEMGQDFAVLCREINARSNYRSTSRLCYCFAGSRGRLL
jgi:hypothetical protein